MPLSYSGSRCLDKDTVITCKLLQLQSRFAGIHHSDLLIYRAPLVNLNVVYTKHWVCIFYELCVDLPEVDPQSSDFFCIISFDCLLIDRY